MPSDKSSTLESLSQLPFPRGLDERWLTVGGYAADGVLIRLLQIRYTNRLALAEDVVDRLDDLRNEAGDGPDPERRELQLKRGLATLLFFTNQWGLQGTLVDERPPRLAVADLEQGIGELNSLRAGWSSSLFEPLDKGYANEGVVDMLASELSVIYNYYLARIAFVYQLFPSLPYFPHGGVSGTWFGEEDLKPVLKARPDVVARLHTAWRGWGGGDPVRRGA